MSRAANEIQSAVSNDVTERSRGIVLSVVVPVYNQAGSVVRNVSVIRDRVAAGVGAAIEVIVVSDGSIDHTEARLLESELRDVRVVHYDRNLGKGYAVKVGALEARGRWIGYVDADLDLDPGALPEYVRVAERDGLDFAIGSKRHPDSKVIYPTSRRIASWLYQQLVLLLFRLDVTDTQVGLKVFRREVAEQVFPLLLVKRYAFDIEMLAVARAFGFGRLRELPVALDYKFTGSGVRPGAVAIALIDTLAIFYRLRILRTYQRKRALVGAYGWTRPLGYRPHVTVVTADPDVPRRLDWPHIDVVLASTASERRDAADRARGELLAMIEPGAMPSGNFVSATAPFLARPQVAAVVTCKMAPAGGNVRQRAAAAVRESRIGGGSQYYRYMPGNIRYVREFSTASYVVRTDRLRELPRTVEPDRVAEELVRRGELVVYTPEAFLVERPPPLFVPHLVQTVHYGVSRGSEVARGGVAALRFSTVLAVVVAVALGLGWLPGLADHDLIWLWAAVLGAYVLALAGSSILAALQFRSIRVAALVAPSLVATHAAYLGGFVAGLVRR